MLEPNTITSLEAFAMLAGCVLAIGFMFGFFLALANDDHKTRMARRLVVNDAIHVAPDIGVPWLKPGTLALGVVRITSVLAASPRRGEERADAQVRFDGRQRQPGSVNERIYRLG
jgi:hypothetical protein